jgi:hypothetical protein
MHTKLIPWITGMALATSACLTQDGGAIELDVADGDERGDEEHPLEGEIGQMTLRWPDGREHLATYVVTNGLAMWQGDISLGPPPLDRGFAIKNMGDERWPDGQVNYIFADSLSATIQGRIGFAIAQYEDLTPIEFEYGIAPGRPYLAFYSDDNDENVSWTSGVGPDGDGDGDETDVTIHVDASTRTIMHELGHAIGLLHEQTRSDRNNHVDFAPSCSVDPGQSEIDTDSDYEKLEDYDIGSLMHYGSTTGCVKQLPGLPAMAEGGCLCYPLVKDGHSHFSESGFIAKAETLSDADLRTIWRMYEPELGDNEDADDYGAALASGDFDADGFADLAVGAPGEAVGDGASAGVVFVYKGTSAGLVGWRILKPSELDSPADGDQFGATLAVGELDGHAGDELIIGAPREDIGSEANAGAIYVYMGTSSGPKPRARFTQGQASVGDSEAGDHFGSALGTGDFDNDGRDELAVGLEGEAPYGYPSSGMVSVLKWNPEVQPSSAFVLWKNLYVPDGGVGGQLFGKSLAVGHLNFDGRADLVVGAPADGLDAKGSAFVFKSVSTSARLELVDQVHHTASGADAPANGDRFGTAVAIGDVDHTLVTVNGTGRRPDEVVIGAPGKNNPVDSGRAFVYTPTFGSGGSLTGMSQVHMFGQFFLPDEDNQANDEFGSVLALGDLDGDQRADLLVGVPFKGLDGTSTRPGRLELFMGGTSPVLLGAESWLPAGSIDTARMGAAVTFGDFDDDGLPDFAAGASNHKTSWLVNETAGTVEVYSVIDAAGSIIPWSQLDQESNTYE